MILHITEGPAVGRRTFLRVGQVLRIGRTEWADFNVPQDAAMAPIHFSVEYDTHICRLRDLQSGAQTLVNGKPVGEMVLNHGDRITAGATTFQVHIEGAHATVVAVAGAAAAAPVRKGSSGYKRVDPPTAAEVCQLFELDDAAKPLLDDKQNVRQFFELLVKQQLYPDAVRFLAHALPKREAMWWAARCVRAALGDGELPRTDRVALEVAERWVIEPDEKNRRAAQNAADSTGYETACGWVAGGAFWSSGSIGPEGMPDVPPKETLTPQAAVVAINLTATVDPRQMQQLYAQFVSIGATIAEGQNRWPEGK
ncbi:MAG TPA: FHA domain-containing protein [Pirellulales bacterium]|nr:FHA domain-containing protein [Pirellulales bacterium]